MKQYTITGTKTFTYYKTVHADDITEAHLLAHEDVEDEEDDWTCHDDIDYDDPIEVVVKNIEDEGEI